MSDPELPCDGALERRAHILWQLRLLGFLAIADLARDLQVSPMTVRRNLHLLEAGGDVRLVHGGAVLSVAALHGSVHPPDPLVAAGRVAALAVASIGRTDTIALDAGPTAFALARCVPDSFRGSVITHSMAVLQLLAECRPDVRVVALGGELSPERRAAPGRRRPARRPGLRPHPLKRDRSTSITVHVDRLFDKGSMATIGYRAAVADAFGMKVTGLPAFLMWGFVHVLYPVGWGNRLGTIYTWLRALVFTKNRGHRIITFEQAGDRLAPGLTASGRPSAVLPPRPRDGAPTDLG